ncbi:GTPase domain-containing protein [Ruania halotolerans]|uniref:GTPase domain-containing protein n=1 Tax=Ruania halotolerans TaxID=2897773 RepID=UPI001E47F4F4|nr:GTPase domain-containing protein [Ruania halotolerans]UFU05322.1 GTPase domain-containing protein [Ruania halotolerans]
MTPSSATPLPDPSAEDHGAPDEHDELAAADQVDGRVPMVEVIEHLLDNLDAASLPLEAPGVEEFRAKRDRLATQVRHHLLPRLKQVAAPVIVVVGGSTGAGKSTIVNSVVGQEVTEAGVLRPTTREPILVVHPLDAELMDTHPVIEVARVSPSEAVPRGMALLDAPDLDSVHAGNRGLADELVELADLWVFVTTGSRYGDAVPWTRLQAASERGVSLSVILNRVDPAALSTVRRDLFERLEAQGFGSVPFFVIPDVGPHEGALPENRIREFTQWLTVLGAKSQSRSIIARTVRGAWPALRQDVQEVALALEEQRRTNVALRNQLTSATTASADRVKKDLTSGAAATGAPTTAWLAGASSGGILAPLVAPPANLFESWRYRRANAARLESVRSLREIAVSATYTLIQEAGERAERALRTAAEESRAGRQVTEAVTAATCASGRSERLTMLFSEWDDVVAELCGTLTFTNDDAGLDAAGKVAMVEAAAVGLDGAARAVTRMLGERGAAVVARLSEDLGSWAHVAVAAEAEPFVAALDDLGVDDQAARSLRLRASELKGYL